MSTQHELIEELRRTRPDVAVKVTWEEDPYYSWDGDGPDPVEDGFLPYNVTVTAMAICKGNLIEGHDHLGGCYSKLGEHCPEIHGYFPQMLEEALEALDINLALVAL